MNSGCAQLLELHAEALGHGERHRGQERGHRTVTPKQAELMHLAIANYRKANKLLRAW
jgi:hypothetical protein